MFSGKDGQRRRSTHLYAPLTLPANTSSNNYFTRPRNNTEILQWAHRDYLCCFSVRRISVVCCCDGSQGVMPAVRLPASMLRLPVPDLPSVRQRKKTYDKGGRGGGAGGRGGYGVGGVGRGGRGVRERENNDNQRKSDSRMPAGL